MVEQYLGCLLDFQYHDKYLVVDSYVIGHRIQPSNITNSDSDMPCIDTVHHVQVVLVK